MIYLSILRCLLIPKLINPPDYYEIKASKLQYCTHDTFASGRTWFACGVEHFQNHQKILSMVFSTTIGDRTLSPIFVMVLDVQLNNSSFPWVKKLSISLSSIAPAKFRPCV